MPLSRRSHTPTLTNCLPTLFTEQNNDNEEVIILKDQRFLKHLPGKRLYDKVRLTRKSILAKKTPKNDLFEWQEIGITSLWEDLDDKILTPGQFLGCSRLPWSITIETTNCSYWEVW